MCRFSLCLDLRSSFNRVVIAYLPWLDPKKGFLKVIAHLLMAVGFDQKCGGGIHPDQDMPAVYCYYKPRQWAKADCMDCGWQLVSSNAHCVGCDMPRPTCYTST